MEMIDLTGGGDVELVEESMVGSILMLKMVR